VGGLLALDDPDLHRSVLELVIEFLGQQRARPLLVDATLLALPEVDDELFGAILLVRVEEDVGVSSEELSVPVVV